MSREQQLELIRQKCIAANPDRGWYEQHPDSDFKDELPCRLADVLLAIAKKLVSEMPNRNREICITSVGEFTWYGQSKLLAEWNLRNDDLTQQSDECIAFLYELLKQ